MKREIYLHFTYIYCMLYLKVFHASNMEFGAPKKKTLQLKHGNFGIYHVHLYDLYVHTSISGLLYLHSETNYEPCFISSRPLPSRVVSWPYCHAWNRPFFGGTLGTLDTMV